MKEAWVKIIMKGIRQYRFSGYSLLLTIILAVITSWVFKWSYAENPVNFMGGDAEDYYSSLISTFINKDITSQTRDVWFLIKTPGGAINQHPLGVAVLLLPFFGIAYSFAVLLHYPVDGMSLPFQAGVAVAGLTYAAIGLAYLRKLCIRRNIADHVIALIIPLVFFGTNLLNYTLSEAGMSHVYSFCLISVFLYHSERLVTGPDIRRLFYAAAIMGLIVLVRPNNVFAAMLILIWFGSFTEARNFFRQLLHNRNFYFSLLLTASIVFFQSLVWYLQSGQFFHQTYKADGFYWLHPQPLKMLFGFEAGFFIYTPLCLLLLGGLVVIYRQNRFSFGVITGFLLALFYFFSAYCSYTFFDGLGIRVLVDYYALFGFLGAKLFNGLVDNRPALAGTVSLAAMLACVNLIYCYQANRGILLRAGMNFNKWKYVFLKTSKDYQDVLGGSNELLPYAKHHPQSTLGKTAAGVPFEYNGREFGLIVRFDTLGFTSNRVNVKVKCARKEAYANASREAYVCMSLEDSASVNKFYAQYRLNETPAVSCCETLHYDYSANLAANFRKNDRLSVYVWNRGLGPFTISEFSVNVTNYNYLIN